jgi:hypothetical protein
MMLILTVTDIGNMNTCIAVVTVIDDTPIGTRDAVRRLYGKHKRR